MKNVGVLAPIVSPCSRDGQPDLDGVRSVAKYVIAAGCHALFAAGSTGRGPWFSRRQRAEICRAAVETAGSRVPVYAGCMASGMQDMVDNAHAMADAGARVAVLTAPGYFNYSDAEVEAVFLRVADKSPLPVMVYDIPDFAKTKLDTDMLRRLSAHENIMGFKDSSADSARFNMLLETVDRPDFVIMQGKENLLAESIAAGASGLVVSLIHVEPALFAQLFDAVRAGRDEEAVTLQTAATRLLALLRGCMDKRPETSTLFQFFDHILTRRGICDNILLVHEGEPQAWIRQAADDAMAVAQEALAAVEAVAQHST